MTTILKSLLYYVLMLSAFALMIFTIGCEDDPYTEVEKHVIEELRAKMHDPTSLEIVNLTSVDLLSYEHFRKLPLKTRTLFLLMKPKDRKDGFKAYTVNYRGANAFGALRLNHVIAFAGKDALTGVFCYFFDEKDLIEK